VSEKYGSCEEGWGACWSAYPFLFRVCGDKYFVCMWLWGGGTFVFMYPPILGHPLPYAKPIPFLLKFSDNLVFRL